MSEPGRVRPALSERSIERVEGPDSVDAEAAAIEMANDALATEIATLRRRLFRINRHINAIHSGRWSSLGAAIRAARTPARTFVLPLRIARILLSRPESVTTPILDEALPTPVARRAATAPDQVRAREPGILRRFTSRAASPARGWHESLLQRGLDGLRALESEWIGASEATPIVLTCYPYTRDNPYQTMLYARCREHGIAPIGITDLAVLADTPSLVGLGADVWCHLHWTQSVLAAAGRRFDARRRLRTFVERLDRFKAQGGHLAWTVHNVLPHEHRFDDLEAGLCQAIADRADLVHVLCSETPSITEPWYRLPAEKVRTIPMASYLGVYPNSISQAQARSDLGLSPQHTVLAFVGSIRPYKNVDGLLDAFAKVAATRPHYRLIVAGAPRALKDVDGLRRRLAAHPQVLVKMERIADADVQRYLNACDVAVLPYRDILNSAALTLALAFGRPVIAPARGCVAGIVTDHVGLLFDPGARDGLAAAIARAEELRDPRYREAALAKARELEPGAIADRFARTLRSVAAAVQRRASGGSLGRPLP